MKFLVVDDDEVDLEQMRRAVARLPGSTLAVARDGIEALSQLRASPDERVILLLDLNMPKMNGLECLHAIRADAALRALRVAVLTTSDDDRDLRGAMQLGVTDYLQKPVTALALQALLAK